MSGEERIHEKEFEDRLRRFTGAEPPEACWAAITRRTQPRAQRTWRYLAAAALLVVAVMTTYFAVLRWGEMRSPRNVAAHRVHAVQAPEGADANGPCLLVMSDNDVW
jgi:cytochrome c-type biogenesis protein CcmH/NrfG